MVLHFQFLFGNNKIILSCMLAKAGIVIKVNEIYLLSKFG